MTMVNVAEAKTHLSRLLDEAEAGKDVIVARNGTPVARLVPIESPSRRALGFVDLAMPDERFDALDEDELLDWS